MKTEQKLSWRTSLGQNKEAMVAEFLDKYLNESEFFNSSIYATYLHQLEQAPDSRVVDAIKNMGRWRMVEGGMCSDE